MSRFNQAPSTSTVRLLLRGGDFLAIVFANHIALLARSFVELPIPMPVSLNRYYAVEVLTALLFLLLSDDMYRLVPGREMLVWLSKVIGRWLMVVGLVVSALFVFKVSHHFSRLWFVLWVPLVAFLLCLDRILLSRFLRSLQLRGLNIRSVALVGAGTVADTLRQRLASHDFSGYGLRLELATITPETLATLDQAGVDEVWLALPPGDEQAIKDTLHALRHSTAAIRYIPDLFTLQLINHGVSEVLGMTMYNLSTSPMIGINVWLKWLEDKLLATLILLFISPLLLLLAIGVKLSSAGPVLYRQTRIGLNNRPFELLKFRTMPVDTEQHGVQWGGSARKATNRFGRLLRRTSLDELPQFWNVLKGDMSIVGPRPERPMFVEQFKDEIPDYMKKHLVKAGITGWAQIHGLRGDTDLQTRIEYDIDYIENWSLWLDLKIITLTLFKGFIHKNAR